MTQPLETIAETVKLSIHQLDSLASHPACVAKFAESIAQNSSEQQLAIFAQSDPAIALTIINLCRQKNIPIDFKKLDFAKIIRSLSKTELLRAALTMKIHQIEDADFLNMVASFITNCGRRAFAGKLIAEKTHPAVATAAVFADVSLFALSELYSKSLMMMYQQSQSEKLPLTALLQKNLGITENTISRLLLQNWQFDNFIADTAWLYKTDSDTLINSLPDARIIFAVRLAEIITDEDKHDEVTRLKWQLGLTDADIDEISKQTKDFASQLVQQLGLDIENPNKFFCKTVQQIYLKQLTIGGSEDIFGQFVQKFTTALKPQLLSIDIAEAIAKVFSECFLTQSICVVAANPCREDSLIASIVEGVSKRTMLINCPAGFSMEQLRTENIPKWFTEQTGIVAGGTECILIRSEGQIIAAIIFSGYMPDEVLLAQITAFAGKVFALSRSMEREKLISQLAVDNLVKPQTLPTTSIEKQDLPTDALADITAEIAAGAAHELNNPLAVISGRAQLLLQSETDETKKLALNQIKEKAGEIHEIVGQLMNYARPPQPKIRPVSPFIVVNNSLEKVKARYLSERLDIRLENVETLNDVQVDAEQVAEAIAQVIYNALESYESGNGPVEIIGRETATNNFIEIEVRDQGCGMSNEVLWKATVPFFSDKSAGRQRGMGLSIAASLLKNNNCTFKIESQLDKGTRVIINLPVASKSENS